MKYTLCLCAIAFSCFYATAQTILPVSKTFHPNGKKEDTLTTASIQPDSMIAFLNRAVITTDALLLNQKAVTIQDRNRKIDSVLKTYIERNYNNELNKKIKELNEASPVKPIATGGVSNLENAKQSYGSLTLGLQFRLSKYKLSSKNWIDPHFIYLMFSAKTATSPDSSSLQKTFMFPELNKRDFVMGWHCDFIKNGWSLAPNFEFSFNRFSDTSLKRNFVSQSFILGFRIQKEFESTPIKTFLSVFPYYSLITVDKKYAVDYRKLIGEDKIDRTFNSLGLNVSAQTTNGILFCNMKYILNKGKNVSSTDLKTFIYTIGTLLSL